MASVIKYLKYWPYIVIVLLALACWHYRGKVSDLELDAQTQATEYQKALVSAQEQARQSEQQITEANTKADEAYQRGREDGQNSANKQLDDYRAGNLRLRSRLTATTRQLSQVTASASKRNDSAQCGLLDSDVEFLVRLAQQADSNTKQLAACQAVILNNSQRPTQ